MCSTGFCMPNGFPDGGSPVDAGSMSKDGGP
jgi:hypothetical protein